MPSGLGDGRTGWAEGSNGREVAAVRAVDGEMEDGRLLAATRACASWAVAGWVEAEEPPVGSYVEEKGMVEAVELLLWLGVGNEGVAVGDGPFSQGLRGDAAMLMVGWV